MTTETHAQIASFIWSICNLLRGPYKRNEYHKVILPLTVLRRFDCILTSTKAAVLKEHTVIKDKGENIVRHRLSQIAGVPFFNLSKFMLAQPTEGSGLHGVLDDPNQLAANLNSYINGFSPMLLWPEMAATSRMSKPLSTNRLMASWRRSWKWKSTSPARWTARLHTRFI